jgi:hypothetical protein
MSIEQLETGLRRLNQDQAGGFAFWDENIIAFRSTLLFAIRATCEMLESRNMPVDCRVELKRQGILLRRCLNLADNYLGSRKFNPHIGEPVCH